MVHLLSKEQLGSRILQQILDENNDEERIQIIVDECLSVLKLILRIPQFFRFFLAHTVCICIVHLLSKEQLGSRILQQILDENNYESYF